MRDIFNHIHPLRAISPKAAVTNTNAYVSEIIDLQGWNGVCFAIISGVLAANSPVAQYTVLVEEGDESNLSDNAAVADADLLGTEALASFTGLDDNETRKIGYVGNKRYVRLTITPNADNSSAYFAAIAILGRGDQMPPANPPV